MNFVQSDTGFSVEVLGRIGMEYREQDKTMFIDSEVLAQKGIAVFKNSITSWKAPHDGEVVTDEKREEIIENIRAAIAFLDDFIEVV